MSAARAFRVLSACAIVAGLAGAFGGCQVALKADSSDGTDLPCDLPQGQPCPGTNGLQCIDGQCRQPPGCVPKDREVCNGVDDTCDGKIDEGFDKDADGYPTCGKFDDTGNPIPNTIDCNDNDPNIHPGVPELCNGADDNCNGVADEDPNNCTAMAPPEQCWTNHRDADGKPDPICVPPDDCRLTGCTTGGCDPTTGKCSNPDCVSNPALCTGGKICDPKSHNCVDAVNAGEPCDLDSQCNARDPSLHCLDSGDGTICTKACCTSDACPSGLFCRHSSSGTAICFKGSSLGTKTAHESCTGPSDCRSGVCTGSKCVDTCCGSLDCGSGGTCVLKSDDEFLCRDSSGTGVYNDSCSGGGDCKSGACLNLAFVSYCTQHCCSSTDCPDGRDTCQLITVGSNALTICQPNFTFPTGATKKGGDTCSGNGDCRSGTCSGSHCDDFCCADADCAGGYQCRPKFDGTYSAMKCVPPPTG